MHSTKMKTRLLPSLSLLVLLLTACTPAAVSPEPSIEQSAAPVAVEPTATAFAPAESAPAEPAADVASAPTEEVAAAPLPVATSRGDALHATDPRTVNLASGGLQFVEFFRFT